MFLVCELHTHIEARTHAWHTHTHACMHAGMAYTHTHTHTHTHTPHIRIKSNRAELEWYRLNRCVFRADLKVVIVAAFLMRSGSEFQK